MADRMVSRQMKKAKKTCPFCAIAATGKPLSSLRGMMLCTGCAVLYRRMIKRVRREAILRDASGEMFCLLREFVLRFKPSGKLDAAILKQTRELIARIKAARRPK